MNAYTYDRPGARDSLCQEHGFVLPAAVKVLDTLERASSSLHRAQMASALLGVQFAEACDWLHRFNWK